MKSTVNHHPTVVAVAHTFQSTGDRLRARRQFQWLVFFALLAALDAVMVYTAFQFSYYIRFRTSLEVFVQDVVPQIAFYEQLWLVLLPVWIGVMFAAGLYNRANVLQGTREASRLLYVSATCAMMLIAADFFHTGIFLARGWILLSLALTFILTGLGRYAMRMLVRWVREFGFLTAPALIVGANNEGQMLAEQLHRTSYSGLELLGFVDDNLPAGSAIGNGLKNLGGLEVIDELVAKHAVEELILTSSALRQEQILLLFEKYGLWGQTNIRLSSGLYQIITTGLQVDEFANVPLVQINRVRLTGVSQAQKSLLDYVIALPLLVVVSPVFALLAALVKFTSPGPVIHRRRVMGVNGSQFDAFKFRTMRQDGDAILAARPDLLEELQRTGKLKDDPRVTRVGKILRKTSLDELPQLINVLRGEMSIVGPRMISPPEMSNYKEHGMNLLTVKPGITGLWQVSGRSDVTYEERVRLDMHYIRNWSIWFDLQILLRTVPAVLQRRGAY
jgi:exopolysaccharide biosynthesis polyprenyl glycosylphosphotransferase